MLRPAAAISDVRVRRFHSTHLPAPANPQDTPSRPKHRAPPSAPAARSANDAARHAPALFRLLVCLLGVADKHRGEQFCAAACTHAWHQPVRNQPGGFGLNRRR
ncbi:DUF5958 family protein [Streptomyces sp. NBC_00847]|uniref:DUF5958 family protein n=1 Tax=Streptomyces sp. NBC_00847 TaxID=2975850 RepID=UPI00338E62A4